MSLHCPPAPTSPRRIPAAGGPPHVIRPAHPWRHRRGRHRHARLRRRHRHPRRAHRGNRPPERVRPPGARCRWRHRESGLHRQPHPLRRPGVLGPVADTLVLARRHQRGDGQLRARHRPGAPGRPQRRRGRPGEHRGHARRGVGSGHQLAVGELSAVPAHAGSQPAGPERGFVRPADPVPPLRAGRRSHRARFHTGRDRTHQGAAARSARSRRARLEHLTPAGGHLDDRWSTACWRPAVGR